MGSPSDPEIDAENRPADGRPSIFARRWLVAGAALAIVGAPAGWHISDVLERDNDFCNACHLSADVPLHIDIRHDFDGRPPATLAGAHAPEASPHGGEFRCIDCHGGTGAFGRARVKALAAKDAFWYVVGHFEEPDGMKWPLLDADCLQCHDAFEEKGDGLGGPAFHDLAVHNVELGVACVECHLSHEGGGNADAWFLHAEVVRPQCVNCHPELAAAGVGPGPHGGPTSGAEARSRLKTSTPTYETNAWAREPAATLRRGEEHEDS